MDEKLRTLLETQRFRVVEGSHTTVAGRRVERQWVVHPGAVVILPMLADSRVCLIKNFRCAVGEELIELPAGTLEPNEPPLATAHRELQEETGFRAGSMEPLHEFFMSPGILNERMYLFVAQDIKPGPAAREPGEEIENLVVPWVEAVAMAVDGRIRDAKTIAGLLLYDQRLRGAS